MPAIRAADDIAINSTPSDDQPLLGGELVEAPADAMLSFPLLF